MKKQSSDTSLQSEQAQISLLRKATIAQRVARATSLSHTVISLSRRAIKRASPALSKQETDLAFVSLHYGQDLADSLRTYLESRNV